MKSYPIHEARATLSKIVDRALAGEPQRVTRRGKEAVVVVSEAEWRRRAPDPAPPPVDDEPGWTPKAHYESLGDLLLDFAAHSAPAPPDEDFGLEWPPLRDYGADFLKK